VIRWRSQGLQGIRDLRFHCQKSEQILQKEHVGPGLADGFEQRSRQLLALYECLEEHGQIAEGDRPADGS
jgi:hypothetical protein